MKRAHYSYAHYADSDIASRFDALRFGGPIGTLVAADQEQVLVDLLDDVDGALVLDVGTGTARAALTLAARGAQVTGLDYSREMLGVGATRIAAAGLSVPLLRADAHRLPFPDRSFDDSVSFRLLMHLPDWEAGVRELCRVTRRRIVVDYPALASTAAMQAAGRTFLHAIGRPTEAYRVFGRRRIDEAFAAGGFRVVRRHPHYVLPIALHKMIGSPAFTRGSEATLGRLGLRAAFGSPVTMLLERCAS